jgi:dTDP-4-dehydrorhamnose 3,5-epimerase
MKIVKTRIKDLVVMEPDVFEDKRGWFTELYNKENFKKSGIKINFVQDNSSFSKKKGTLRGLHFQNYPYTQAKLVYCTRGAVLDIVIDLRKNSATYKKWFSIKLSEKNRKQLI